MFVGTYREMERARAPQPLGVQTPPSGPDAEPSSRARGLPGRAGRGSLAREALPGRREDVAGRVPAAADRGGASAERHRGEVGLPAHATPGAGYAAIALTRPLVEVSGAWCAAMWPASRSGGVVPRSERSRARLRADGVEARHAHFRHSARRPQGGRLDRCRSRCNSSTPRRGPGRQSGLKWFLTLNFFEL